MGDYTNCLMRGYGVVASSPTNVKVTNVDVTFGIIHWDLPKTLGDTVTHYNVHYRQLDDIYITRKKVYALIQVIRYSRVVF